MWSSLLGKTNDSFKLKTAGTAERILIEQRLKALLARYKWRTSAYFQVLNTTDPVIQKAMEALAK